MMSSHHFRVSALMDLYQQGLADTPGLVALRFTLCRRILRCESGGKLVVIALVHWLAGEKMPNSCREAIIGSAFVHLVSSLPSLIRNWEWGVKPNW